MFVPNVIRDRTTAHTPQSFGGYCGSNRRWGVGITVIFEDKDKQPVEVWEMHEELH